MKNGERNLQAKLKNPITGNESVVLDKKVYDDARWSFVRQENRLLKKRRGNTTIRHADEKSSFIKP